MLETKKANAINDLTARILSGEFGGPGEKFVTTRGLGEMCDVSLVTAQRIMSALKDRELIALVGKQYYLSYGRLGNNSPMKRRRERSGIIGLHIVNLDNFYFATLARTVERVAHEKGYEVAIASSGYNFEEEKNALKLFERIGADGVISCPSRGSAARELYSRYRLPFVFLSGAVDGVDADRVLINNYVGGKNVAEHFVKNGYVNFMYVAPDNMKHNSDARLNGYIDGLREYGYTLSDDDIIYTDSGNNRILENYVGHLLSVRKKPLGLFCYHDLLAVEAMGICRRQGLDVPSEVGICGYDNLSILRDTMPSLTSVDYRINRLVGIAVSLLNERINGNDGEKKERFIDPILTVRGSTSRIENQ